jgi:hypothetical protein
MSLSTLELASARAIVRGLLEQLCLQAYLFEVEPGDTHWQIRVDCAANAQWQSLLMAVDRDQLMAAENAGAARATLLAAWHEQPGASTRSRQDAK